MCTVSWCQHQEGYTLFFNRDESRTRQLAQPPKIERIEDTACIYPQDPDGGGTWLLLNEHGLTFGLLNYYEAQVDYQPDHPQTRGKLPLKLASSKSLQEARSALERLDFSPYPPLHFLAIDPFGKAEMVTWDGYRKRFTQPDWKDLPITTSSFETTEVVERRKSLFKSSVEDASSPIPAMKLYHSSRQPEPESFAVIMNRPDAKTVSVTQIQVSASKAEMQYRARPDESDRLDKPISLILPRSR